MSFTNKGGRGRKAPYETVQVRTPLPVKEKVEKVIADYRAEVLGGIMAIDKDKVTKASGYLPIDLYAKLEIFALEKDLSISQALITILSEYFCLDPENCSPLDKKFATLEQVEKLEAQIKSLTDHIASRIVDLKPAQMPIDFDTKAIWNRHYSNNKTKV